MQNSSSIFPLAVLPDEEDGDDALPMLMDSPQCVLFGMFMIW